MHLDFRPKNSWTSNKRGGSEEEKKYSLHKHQIKKQKAKTLAKNENQHRSFKKNVNLDIRWWPRWIKSIKKWIFEDESKDENFEKKYSIDSSPN
jgi:hypothetical protein